MEFIISDENEPIKGIRGQSFVCPRCSKAFETNSLLSAHKLWHLSYDKRSQRKDGDTKANPTDLLFDDSTMEYIILGAIEPSKNNENQVKKKIDELSKVPRKRGRPKGSKTDPEKLELLRQKRKDEPERFPRKGDLPKKESETSGCAIPIEPQSDDDPMEFIISSDVELIKKEENKVPPTLRKNGQIDGRSTVTMRKGRKLYTCRYCDFVGNNAKEKAKHTRKFHKPEKTIKCELCDYVGRSNYDVKLFHILNPSKRYHEEPKFKCSLCEYKSFSKSNFDIHMRKHNGEKFNCGQCDFVTHDPRTLKNHIFNTHAEKLLQCEFCDYRTNKKCQLDDHIKQNHTMERPFKCDQCDFAATNEKKLKRHKVGLKSFV